MGIVISPVSRLNSFAAENHGSVFYRRNIKRPLCLTHKLLEVAVIYCLLVTKEGVSNLLK